MNSNYKVNTVTDQKNLNRDFYLFSIRLPWAKIFRIKYSLTLERVKYCSQCIYINTLHVVDNKVSNSIRLPWAKIFRLTTKYSLTLERVKYCSQYIYINTLYVVDNKVSNRNKAS